MDFSNENRNLQIANYLQTLRLEQNLTLEQLSNLSQVPIIHLTSIEEGRFSKFDAFYLKLYLKRYTQSLDVDLEKLYTYASQNPLPDLSENAINDPKTNDQQMTQTQANISATPKNIANTKPQRNHRPQLTKTNVKSANVARLEAKKKFSNFIISLFFLILLIVLVFFIVIIIRDLGNNAPSQSDSVIPPLVDNPHDINLGSIDDDEYESEPELVPEPEIVDFTTVELYNYTSTTQTFDVATTLEEIELQIEFSANCWLELRFNGQVITSGVYDTTLEEIVELVGDGNDTFNLQIGNLFGVESITLNGETVDFDDTHSVQLLDFNITLESE